MDLLHAGLDLPEGGLDGGSHEVELAAEDAQRLARLVEQEGGAVRVGEGLGGALEPRGRLLRLLGRDVAQLPLELVGGHAEGAVPAAPRGVHNGRWPHGAQSGRCARGVHSGQWPHAGAPRALPDPGTRRLPRSGGARELGAP